MKKKNISQLRNGVILRKIFKNYLNSTNTSKLLKGKKNQKKVFISFFKKNIKKFLLNSSILKL